MKQNEVWLIDLNPTLGAEIKKTRPAIIVNDDALGKLPLKIIIPITDWKEKYSIAPWMVEIKPTSKNGLRKHSAGDCFQIRSVSQVRFIKKLGAISKENSEKIKIGLSRILSLT